jgi:hypothetical protein
MKGELMRRIRAWISRWQFSESSVDNTRARIVSRKLVEIEKELKFAQTFMADEVAQVFHHVDVTFHSIFMRTSKKLLMRDIEYLEVASELENSLRAITDRTSGKLVVSNKLDTALDTISENEDVYYILTYVPSDLESVGKIKIETNNRKHKLVYSPKFRSGLRRDFIEGIDLDGIPIQIKKCNFQNKRLTLLVSDFYWHNEEGGKLTIRVQVKNNTGASIFDQKKTINATKKQVNISLNFSNLDKGDYNFIVDVQDLYTNKTATEMIKTKIIP